MRKRKIRMDRVLLLVVGIFLIIFGLTYLLFLSKDRPITMEIATTPIPTAAVVKDNFDWTINHKENSEFIGRIQFENGLISENVVQTTDNEKYLNLSWDLQESTHGAAFMDYRNTLEDQNIIIYGHYVYKDESLIFGPLHNLDKQENYEANKVIELNLENETRKYEVVYVYYYELDNPIMEYFHTNFEAEYFDLYQKSIKEKAFYDTGLSLTMNDKLLTLQTCVRNRDDLRLIIVAKQI